MTHPPKVTEAVKGIRANVANTCKVTLTERELRAVISELTTSISMVESSGGSDHPQHKDAKDALAKLKLSLSFLKAFKGGAK